MAELLFANPLTQRSRAPSVAAHLDYPLLLTVLALGLLGIVMVGSASVSIAEKETGDALYFLKRQGVYALLAAVGGWVALHIPLRHWEGSGALLLAFAYFLLALVLVPGVGKEVNGSVRWIPLGPLNVQVSEVAKLFIMVYLAGYLVRRHQAVQASMAGFLIPVGLLSVAAFLLLLEPDFGAAAVVMATGLGMLFIAGVALHRFLALLTVVGAAAAALVLSAPYRWQRMTSFIDPWADPFDAGFQLTQSLIAIGRGGVFGVGLGGSVQKLFYLPEAHTDFLFAVLAEELGLVGVLAVIGLYAFLVWRIFAVGRRAYRADSLFGAYLAHGVGIWLGLQALVNMGVNMGLLPTKGLTLPLLSYGGSSLMMTALALALVLRVDHEVRIAGVAAERRGGGT